MDATYFFDPHWPVLFEDNHLLALYKPAGLLIQADQTGEPSLLALGKEWIKRRYQKTGQVYLGLVHRLDRPVAGVVLFARTSKAAGRLSAQFRARQVTKIYWAVVKGRLQPLQGHLLHHLIRRPGFSSVVAKQGSPSAQEASLTYQVLDVEGDRSLVEVRLESGRHHQIRCQMAHVGHPIIGDLRYGAAHPLPRRQIALFARELVVTHPTHKLSLSLRCPLPRGWPWRQEFEEITSVPWNWSEMLADAVAGEASLRHFLADSRKI